MNTLRTLWARVKGQGMQAREDEAFDAEIREHIALLEERYRAQGMSEIEAARVARLQFGNVTVLKERLGAQRGFLALAEWRQDVRFGARMLAKRPVSSAAVIIALALGIGLNSAVFTFFNALLLRPPQGVPATDKLVELWLHSSKGHGVLGYLTFDYPDYAYFRDHTMSLEGMAAFAPAGRNAIWNHGGIGEILQGQLVTGNGFDLLGVHGVVGRTISVDDDRIDNPRQVVLLSYPFWKQKLGGDAGVIGRTLMLNGAPFTVIGVMPAGFSGVVVGIQPDFWAPMALLDWFTRANTALSARDSHSLIVAGRMRAAGDRRKVQAEMHVLARQVYLAHGGKNDSPDTVSGGNGDFLDTAVYPLTMVPGPFRGYVGAFTGSLQAVFALVLLIACTNAASLLLARATGRAREMATRSALGAGRARLVRQMLVESLMLAGLGGAAGVAIAWVSSRLLMNLKPENIPIALAIPMDWRVVLFTVAVSVATGLVFGLAPALRASAVPAARVLKEESSAGSRKKSRLLRALVVAQMVACVVLLAGAALCARSLMNANTIDTGFDIHHIAMASLDPSNLGYTPEKVNDFYRRLRERVESLPGVTSVSYVQFMPLSTSETVSSVSRQLGDDSATMTVDEFMVEPGFFRTLGIPLLRGRDLTQKEVDTDKPTAVVINETLAQKFWPGEDPLGKHLAIREEKTMAEVVGVVKNGKYRTLGEGPAAALFSGHLPAARTLVVRSTGSSQTLLEEIRREVPMIDSRMAATQVQTIEQFMALPLFPARTMGWLLGVSGLLALIMTAVGLFGVIAYMVSQRTHEIGVRMALGAGRGDVMKMVMAQGLRLTVIGLGIGLVAAFGAARLLSPLLYGIGANDPATMLAVVIALATIALIACYLPARKAMSVDSSVALRYE